MSAFKAAQASCRADTAIMFDSKPRAEVIFSNTGVDDAQQTGCLKRQLKRFDYATLTFIYRVHY